LGIGTPIIDQTVLVDDRIAASHAEEAGSMQLVDYDTFLSTLKQSKEPPIASIGGSALNTIRGLACLGHSCAIFGKIGNDALGKKIYSHLESLSIRPCLIPCPYPTAQVACMVTSDSERTMRSFLGAGAHLRPEDLSASLFEGIKLVHIEGYLFACPGVVPRAMQLARQAGACISFDLANFEIVARYKAEMAELLSSYVDIVFANAQESFAMTGLIPERSCIILKDLSEIAIVKMGEQGGWVANAEENLYYPAVKVKAVDSTGAGDFFASGFLDAYLRNKGLTECASQGALVASEAVKIIGTEIAPQRWQAIREWTWT
jgi:sugar/nucleoside kinase (ribokinase family)